MAKDAAAGSSDKTHKAQKSGRTTPKGGTGRYTPPTPRAVKVGRPWVPVLKGVLLGVGAILILLNYFDLLPGGASNAYLLVGLALITGGFITATQWR